MKATLTGDDANTGMRQTGTAERNRQHRKENPSAPRVAILDRWVRKVSCTKIEPRTPQVACS